MSRRTARCSTCKVEIGLTDDGERFLYHHAQGPGIGPVCDRTGQSAAPVVEEES